MKESDIKELLYRFANLSIEPHQPEFDSLLALLKRHPRYEEKAGAGVASFYGLFPRKPTA